MAAGSPPDRAFRTPIARTPAARESGALSAASLGSQLDSLMRQAPSASGIWVMDTGAKRVVYRKRSTTRRILASNTKLFTTSTALSRFGVDARLFTKLWGVGAQRDSTFKGTLYLVGAGDPALASRSFSNRYVHHVGTNLAGLAGRLRSKGITSVTGRLLYDDTIFDRLRGVAYSNYRTTIYIGPLSGLDYNSGFAGSSTSSGFARDPAVVAAHSLNAALRAKGIAISRSTAFRKLPPRRPRVQPLVRVPSPTMTHLVTETDRYSNNFFAEMLIKGLGARFGSGGTTRAGAAVVRRFARRHGTGVHNVDGSGLTHSNKASPEEVGKLLAAMLRSRVSDAFTNALPLAGHQGTVASRMRGSAADGRCRTKTGTLTGVSALSGYCFNRNGKKMVFSILMNGVSNDSAAHSLQDRMAAAIARY